MISQYLVLSKPKGVKEFKAVAVLKNQQAIKIVNGSIARLRLLAKSIADNNEILKTAKGEEKTRLEEKLKSDKLQVAQIQQVLLSYDIPLNTEMRLQPARAGVYLILKVSELESLINNK